MFSPNRIDLNNSADVLLWADMLSVTVEQLVEAVGKVGPMSASVKFYLTKSATERKPSKTAAPRADKTPLVASAATA